MAETPSAPVLLCAASQPLSAAAPKRHSLEPKPGVVALDHAAVPFKGVLAVALALLGVVVGAVHVDKPVALFDAVARGEQVERRPRAVGEHLYVMLPAFAGAFGYKFAAACAPPLSTCPNRSRP